jgi:hypothetical protein
MPREYTEPQKAAFREAFDRRKRRQMILGALVLALLIFGRVLPAATRQEMLAGVPESTVTIGVLVLVLGVIAFSFRNWRCPACNRYLGRSMNPRFCDKCGVELRKD